LHRPSAQSEKIKKKLSIPKDLLRVGKGKKEGKGRESSFFFRFDQSGGTEKREGYMPSGAADAEKKKGLRFCVPHHISKVRVRKQSLFSTGSFRRKGEGGGAESRGKTYLYYQNI